MNTVAKKIREKVTDVQEFTVTEKKLYETVKKKEFLFLRFNREKQNQAQLFTASRTDVTQYNFGLNFPNFFDPIIFFSIQEFIISSLV